MKSAYELVMARLEAQEPSVKLTEEQKKKIADIETKFRADLAAKELLLRGEIEKAVAAGDFEEEAKIRRQLSDETSRLEEKRDREKEGVRAGG